MGVISQVDDHDLDGTTTAESPDKPLGNCHVFGSRFGSFVILSLTSISSNLDSRDIGEVFFRLRLAQLALCRRSFPPACRS